MNQRHLPGRANIITHIHTEASNARASEMDPLIGGALRRTVGKDTTIDWTECFTPVGRLSDMLARRRGKHGPVDMVLVTDHMRRESHRLGHKHLAAAARQPRLALCAEFATRTLDVDGRYHKGPEILAYGTPAPVQGPYGPYFGLSQDLIDELYDSCMTPARDQLCTRAARDLLVRRGVAHGISHPYDGHHLSFEGMFRIISEFCFIETLNGGFFAESTEVLDAYIAIHNGLLAGARLPPLLTTPLVQRLADHIRRVGRPLVRWSGSDAHVRDLDRVVVAMAPDPGCRPEALRPGDLFATMLRIQRGQEGTCLPGSRRPRFVHLGRPATPVSQTHDVVQIILRNLVHNARPMANPRVGPKVVDVTYRTTHGELARRAHLQDDRRADLLTRFNPVAVAEQLDVPRRKQQDRTEKIRRLRSVA